VKAWLRLGDGSTWPRPALESDPGVSVEWKLRHTPGALTREDRMFAASVLHAYNYLLCDMTQKRRNTICREIRQQLEQENHDPTLG
jgi:hypothetical protein